MIRESPCKGCEKRTITCHGVCKEYQEWKTENENHRESIRAARDKQYILAKKRKKDNY
jgi:hypothetical protein